MDKKDFVIRAFQCRLDNSKRKPSVECLICPYGKNGDFAYDEKPEDVKCNLLKLYNDIGTLLVETGTPLIESK